jgi:hypothetical protein
VADANAARRVEVQGANLLRYVSLLTQV